MDGLLVLADYRVNISTTSRGQTEVPGMLINSLQRRKKIRYKCLCLLAIYVLGTNEEAKV